MHDTGVVVILFDVKWVCVLVLLPVCLNLTFVFVESAKYWRSMQYDAVSYIHSILLSK